MWEYALCLTIPFLVMLIHEGAHYCTARALNYPIEYELSPIRLKGRIVFFRSIWYIPGSVKWKQYFIATAGFFFEFLIGFVFALLYHMYGSIFLVVTVVHLALYPFYCGRYSDFEVFKEDYHAHTGQR